MSDGLCLCSVVQDGTDSPTAGQDLQDGSESLVSSDGTLQSLSVSSSGQRVGSETSGQLPWRERLLSGAGTSPERSDSGMDTERLQMEPKW